MLYDLNTQVATALAVTSSAVVSDSVSLAVASDIGKGSNLNVHFQVVTAAFVSGTDLTLEVISATDGALTADVEVIGSAGTIAAADLTLNAQFVARINPRSLSQTKGTHVGVRLTPTGTFSTGEMDARITPAAIDSRDYHDANTPGVIT